MKQLVVASNNRGKIAEISAMVQNLSLLSLADIGFTEDIPEPFDSFEENALTKASTVQQFYGGNVFSDDSGICVPSLGGAPGVHSAYYGGLTRTDQKNNEKLLQMLSGLEDRRAFYKAVICLIWEDQTYFFEGICHGRILEQPEGEGGFGYDPLFVPDGYEQTFASLSPEIKNSISHRGQAIRQMVNFLNSNLVA
ncbi:MAG: RdgB/HAM1 family non-canonical purine NTP pyrophosphatase [Sphingobacteriales bacterium]|nr:MAG: RdgB/HAM1 family non-canonical purine NTP pyrophosphatase [Sphingobacteriales bacterium]